MLSLEKPGTPEELVYRYITTKIPLKKPGTPQELNHHGIKGMRWGIRKKEETSDRKPSAPKPVSERREKRAQGREAHAREAQAQIDKIKNNPSTFAPTRIFKNHQIKDLEQQQDRALRAAQDLRAGHLFTREQKKVLIGAGVAGGLIATYGAYKLWDTGVGRSALNNNLAPFKFKKNPELNREGMSPFEIFDKVVKPINPNYGESGTKSNCRRATFAYEMRRRGYDVKASRTKFGKGQGPDELVKVTGLAKAASQSSFGRFRVGGEGFSSLTPEAKAAQIYNSIRAHGDGARGELGVQWSQRVGGGRHSMAWENINGIVHIFDPQVGRHYSMESFTDNVGWLTEEAGITRLDNLKLDSNIIGRWVQRAK